MKTTTKEFILACIKQMRGDDLYRARCAFKHCTPKEMDEKYGQSDETRQQIIDGYEKHNEKCDAAIDAINEL